MFGIFRGRKSSDSKPRELALKDDGNRLLGEGRLAEAEACYRQAIALNDTFVACYVNLGFVLNEQGRRDDADSMLQRAVALDSAQADAWYMLGNNARMRGDLPVAIGYFERAREADPRLAVVYPALAQALLENGKREEARRVLEQGIAVDSHCANVHFLLGNLLCQEGGWEAAAGHFGRELEIQPNFAEAHVQLGNALKAQDKLEPAFESYRRATEMAPGSADAHYGLGFVLENRGETRAAIESYRRALALTPDSALVRCQLGSILFSAGDYDQAIPELRRALDIDSSNLMARHNLGSALLRNGNPDEAIACFREALRIGPEYAEAYLNLGTAYELLGELDEAKRNYRQAMSIDRSSAVALHTHSNLLVLLSQGDHALSAEYLREARRYGEEALARARPFASWPLSLVNHDVKRRLKVGFVSADLHEHPVGFFLECVLEHLDASCLSLHAYAASFRDDALSARIKPLFDDWTLIANLSDEAAARRIHDDGIDILVDLTGHLAHNRLPMFAWKPAPLQASWLGYWASTGVPGIDYLLADPTSVPANRQADFSEAIWYLPETRLCFSPPADGAAFPVTSPPVLRNGHITFGCYQQLLKISDTTLALWGRALRSLPDARLRIQDKHLAYAPGRDRLLRRLANVGITPDRVNLYGRVPRSDYLATYADVDLILDTFPFSGGTTTCEALWMGVPTLTLAGQTLIARQGASMLTCVGLANDWVALGADEYVAKALARAADIRGLARLRATLRQRALDSALFDASRFARNLEDALVGMWRRKMSALAH